MLLAVCAGSCRCGAREVDQALELTVRAERERRPPGPWLWEVLAHPQAVVRARACLAAGRIGAASGEVLDHLTPKMSDGAPSVRRQAIFGARLLVLDTPIELGRAALALKLEGELRRRLEQERDDGVRREILRSLGWTAAVGSEPALHALARQLEGAQVDAALEALVVWGGRGQRLAGTGLAQGLARALTSRRIERRRLAAMAVAQAGGTDDAELTRRLLKCGEAQDASLRRWTTEAVGRGAKAARQLDWLVQRLRDHEPVVQVAAIRALGMVGREGARRVARELGPIWRSVSANHFRLTGPQIRPVLVALVALRRFSDMPEVAEVAREVLELADATDATVSYGAKEAQAVDLVHCTAAQLVDQVEGRLEHTPGCGTAGSKRLTPAMRRVFEVEVSASLGREPTWTLEQLDRALRHEDARVRAAAAGALGRAGVARSAGRAHEKGAASGEPLPSPVQARLDALLRRGLQDPRAVVVAAAAGAVERQASRLTGGREHLTALVVQRLAGESGAGCRLARALVALRPSKADALPALSTLARGSVTGVRQCALAAAARLGAQDGRAARPEMARLFAPPPPSGAKLPRRAKVVTSRGVFHLRLLVDEAPGVLAHLVHLAQQKRWGRLEVGEASGHRLELRSGAEDRPIPCEPTAAPFVAGTVGLSLPAGRDTGGGDLFIVLDRQPWLDGRFTRVATVEPEGMELLRRLQPGDEIRGIYPQRDSGQPGQR